jgi:hypothetical protein
MSRIALERVVFFENLDKPLNEKGASPGLDRIFERHPKMGRFGYELWLDGEIIIIRDPKSGREEEAHVTTARQWRRLAKDAEKLKAV